MAVTINQSPSTDFVLSGNPIVWVFSSNQTAQVNFSYYVEVYVDSVLHSTHQVFPESGIYGKFDASEILDSLLNAPQLPTGIVGYDALDYLNVSLTVYERYGATPTLQASAVTSSLKSTKGKLFLNNWINTNVNTYYVGSTNRSLLTNCPDIKLRSEEKLYFFGIIEDIGSSTINLTYKDSSGSTVNTESISINNYDVTGYLLSYAILDGYYPLDNVSTVDFYLDIDSGAATTITYTINIDNSCAEYTARLHFLNQLGGIDAFTFTQVGRYNATTETQSFLTTQGTFDGATFGWDGLNSQVNNYQVGVNRKLKIESGWITADVQEWLNNNLFTSPYVLLETSNGLLRVANMSTSVTYNRSKTDMLFNTVIEIDELHHTSMIV